MFGDSIPGRFLRESCLIPTKPHKSPLRDYYDADSTKRPSGNVSTDFFIEALSFASIFSFENKRAGREGTRVRPEEAFFLPKLMVYVHEIARAFLCTVVIRVLDITCPQGPMVHSPGL